MKVTRRRNRTREFFGTNAADLKSIIRAIGEEVDCSRLPPRLRSFLSKAEYCHEVVPAESFRIRQQYWCEGCNYYASLSPKKQLSRARGDYKTKKLLCPKIWKKDVKEKKDIAWKDRVLKFAATQHKIGGELLPKSKDSMTINNQMIMEEIMMILQKLKKT